MAKKSYVECLKDAIRGHNYSYAYSSGSSALQKKTSYQFSEKLYGYLRKACGHDCEVVLADFDEESLKREREFSAKAYEEFKANGFKRVVKSYDITSAGNQGQRRKPIGHIGAMTDADWNANRGWRVPFTAADKKRLKKLKYGKGSKNGKRPYVMDNDIMFMYPEAAHPLNLTTITGKQLEQLEKAKPTKALLDLIGPMEVSPYLDKAKPMVAFDPGTGEIAPVMRDGQVLGYNFVNESAIKQTLAAHQTIEDPLYTPEQQAALKEAAANAPTIVLEGVNELNLYSDATNYRKFPEIGDVKVEVGFGEAEPVTVPLEERPFLFREHRGGFAESMATMHELEGTKASLLTYLKSRLLISEGATPDMIEVTLYAEDPRGWLETYIVVSKDPAFEGVLGYTNGPVAEEVDRDTL